MNIKPNESLQTLRDIVHALEKHGNSHHIRNEGKRIQLMACRDTCRPHDAIHPLPRTLDALCGAYVKPKQSLVYSDEEPVRTDARISSPVPAVVSSAEQSLAAEVEAIRTLSATASKYPYYRFNYAWTRPMQDAVCSSPCFFPCLDFGITYCVVYSRRAWFPLSKLDGQCFSILLCGYLGGFRKAQGGELLTIEEVGGIMRGTSLNITYKRSRSACRACIVDRVS